MEIPPKATDRIHGSSISTLANVLSHHTANYFLFPNERDNHFAVAASAALLCGRKLIPNFFRIIINVTIFFQARLSYWKQRRPTHRNAWQRVALLFSLRYAVWKSSDFPSGERAKIAERESCESERMDWNVCQKASITQSKHARMCCRMHGAYHAIHNPSHTESKASSNDFAHHSTALREEEKKRALKLVLFLRFRQLSHTHAYTYTSTSRCRWQQIPYTNVRARSIGIALAWLLQPHTLVSVCCTANKCLSPWIARAQSARWVFNIVQFSFSLWPQKYSTLESHALSCSLALTHPHRHPKTWIVRLCCGCCTTGE